MEACSELAGDFEGSSGAFGGPRAAALLFSFVLTWDAGAFEGAPEEVVGKAGFGGAPPS